MFDKIEVSTESTIPVNLENLNFFEEVEITNETENHIFLSNLALTTSIIDVVIGSTISGLTEATLYGFNLFTIYSIVITTDTMYSIDLLQLT